MKIHSFCPLVDNLTGDWIFFDDVPFTCGHKLNCEGDADKFFIGQGLRVIERREGNPCL
jgi:hypothetical protein